MFSLSVGLNHFSSNISFINSSTVSLIILTDISIHHHKLIQFNNISHNLILTGNCESSIISKKESVVFLVHKQITISLKLK
ncbi:MAG: hypothetical protein Q8S84_03560 [bacterium]|nr:hypothetical protein [bacterium]